MAFRYMKSNSELPAHYQFPEFLLNMDLSQTAKIIYMRFITTSRGIFICNCVSKKNSKC